MERPDPTPGDPTDPRPVTLNRRRLLQATATLAVGSSLAGCAGGLGGGGADAVGERPGYSRWIGTEHVETAREERDGFVVLRTGFRELRELESADDASGEFVGGQFEEDSFQLAAAPLWGGIAFLFVASMGLFVFGEAAAQVTTAMSAGMGDEEDAEADSPHGVDTGLLVGRLVVFEGEFDVEAFGAVEGFEATESYGGFQFYEGVESDASLIDRADLAFAVRDDAVLFPFPASDVEDAEGWEGIEAVDILRSHVDVAEGDAEEAADGDEDFDWALRAGGGGSFVFGGHGLEEPEVGRTDEESTGPELDRLEPLTRDAETFFLSMAIDPTGEGVTADGGFAYPEPADRPDEAAFEALVEGATVSTVTVDGARARVEAEWSASGTSTSS